MIRSPPSFSLIHRVCTAISKQHGSPVEPSFGKPIKHTTLITLHQTSTTCTTQVTIHNKFTLHHFTQSHTSTLPVTHRPPLRQRRQPGLPGRPSHQSQLVLRAPSPWQPRCSVVTMSKRRCRLDRPPWPLPEGVPTSSPTAGWAAAGFRHQRRRRRQTRPQPYAERTPSISACGRRTTTQNGGVACAHSQSFAGGTKSSRIGPT